MQNTAPVTLIEKHHSIQVLLRETEKVFSIGDYLVLDRTDRYSLRVGEVLSIDLDRGYVAYRDHTNNFEDFLYLTDPAVTLLAHYRTQDNNLSKMLARSDAFKMHKELTEKQLCSDPTLNSSN